MGIGPSPIPDKNIKCHRTGFAKTCQSIVTKGQCRLWMHIVGQHPQSGAHVEQWGCADEFVPLLLIENTQQQRQTGAAVESLRNQDARVADALVVLNGREGPRLINGKRNDG